MINLPYLEILEESNYHFHSTFIKECLEHSFQSNLYSLIEPNNFLSYSDFTKWSQEATVYICYRNNKKIGFFMLIETFQNNNRIVQVVSYNHPKVCKLATISITRSLAVTLSLDTFSKGAAEYFGSTIHGLVCSTLGLYFNIKILKGSSYYIFTLPSQKENMNKYLKETIDQEDLKLYMGLQNLKEI